MVAAGPAADGRHALHSADRRQPKSPRVRGDCTGSRPDSKNPGSRQTLENREPLFTPGINTAIKIIDLGKASSGHVSDHL